MSRSARRKSDPSPTADGFVYCGEIRTASESGVSVMMRFWLPPDEVAKHGRVVPPAPPINREEAA